MQEMLASFYDIRASARAQQDPLSCRVSVLKIQIKKRTLYLKWISSPCRKSLNHRKYRRHIDRSRFGQVCRHCNKSFQKPSQLERHERIHTGEKPYKCNQCDRAFNQKGSLQIHLLKHSGVKSHVCQFCTKTFSQRGNLRSHILVSLNAAASLIAINRVYEIWNVCFLQRCHNQPGDNQYYQCQECSCVFRKLGSLNAHMSREHSTQEVHTPGNPR